jgi:RNA polymerase sigma-70 factor (ECF subfamily)
MEASTLHTWNNLQRELRSFVVKSVKDKSVADDIVQDVFIKVQSNVGQLRASDKISAWIYRITKNMVIDYFRKSTKAIQPADLDWESDHHEFNDCVARTLSAMLATLPEKYRVALELTDIENMSQYELALQLDISYAGARARVQRARKMLKAKMDEFYIIETDHYGNITVCENRTPCCRPCP